MRLTELVNKGMNETPIYVGSYGNIVNVGDNQATSMAHHKLGQLEDIEDELGIDLMTYFKLKAGVKVYSSLLSGDDLTIENVFGVGKDALYHIVPRNSRSGVYVGLKEYGRNWALTKEELEQKMTDKKNHVCEFNKLARRCTALLFDETGTPLRLYIFKCECGATTQR